MIILVVVICKLTRKGKKTIFLVVIVNSQKKNWTKEERIILLVEIVNSGKKPTRGSSMLHFRVRLAAAGVALVISA